MKSFDPYHTWLGIPSDVQPPDDYRLLGLQPFESDPTMIDHAADRQMTHVQGFQHGPHAECSQRLLNEISAARCRLLDPVTKGEYDLQLRRRVPLDEPPIARQPPVAPPAAVSRARPDQRRPLVEIAKIALGGLAGIALAGLVLQRFWGIDLIGRKQSVPAIAAARGDSDPAGEQSTEFSSSHRVPRTDQSEPNSTISAATGDESDPAKTADTQGEAGDRTTQSQSSQTARPTESSSTDTEAAKTSSDDHPDIAPSDKPMKHAVPSMERQAAIRRQIEELFKTDDAKQPADKLELVNELTKVADDSESSPEDRFVLVRCASELAVDGGELATAVALVAHLSREFDFDSLVVKQATIFRFAKAATKEAAVETAVAAEIDLITAAEQAGRYDLVLETAEALVEICQRPAGAKYRKQARDTRDEAHRLQAESFGFQNALKKLEEAPGDAEAHLTAGRWLCLRRQEWDMGLPLLAKGSDKSLAAAAKFDLAETTSADEMLGRADQWYAIGMANAADRGFVARAAYWYGQAKPLATGLAKAKADKRLADIASAHGSAVQLPSLVAMAALVQTTSAAKPTTAPGINDSSASNSSSNDTAPHLGGHTKWVGLGVHTKGPYLAQEFQREELQVVAAKGEGFSANLFWIAYTSKEGTRGNLTIDGSHRGDSIEWQSKSNSARGNGWLRNNVLFLTWDKPPSSGEYIYVPATGVKVAPFAGKYIVSGAVRETFQLELRPDGSAFKSHLPGVNGAWLGTTDRVWIVWTDGWRDVLFKDRGKLTKQAFRPGSSLNDAPTNTGVAKRID